MAEWKEDVEQARRFEFGRNWERFQAILTPDRILEAQRSLREALGRQTLTNSTFLDIGSGSGLFSLAARRLGAQVRSFDFDPDSVACTERLKAIHYPEDRAWTIDRGDVLDRAYLATLGTFDVVYAWGVLHHTGDLWQALSNSASLVAEGGLLYVAIYNDQPLLTPCWTAVKRFYNHAGRPLRWTMAAAYYTMLSGAFLLADLARGRNPLDRHRGKSRRGMGIYRDVVDWLGGYPFQTATPKQVLEFAQKLGFTAVHTTTVGRKSGCNEFVFQRSSK